MAGITTPFTTPTFPVPADRHAAHARQPHAGLRAAERTERRADRADADRRPRTGRVRGRRGPRLRLRAAVERVGPARAVAEHDVRSGVRRLEHHARRPARHQPESAHRRVSWRSGTPLLQRVPNPYFGIIPRSSSLGDPTITVGQLLKPFPEYTTVSLYRNNVGTTRYDGLELSLRQRLSRGLQYSVAYTRSKLDGRRLVGVRRVDSDRAGRQLPGRRQLQPDARARLLDRRHPACLRVVGHLGSAVRDRARARAARRRSARSLSDWTVVGLVTLQSGMPIAVTQTTNFNAFAGFGTQRPNLVGDPTLPADQRTAAHWFNTAAFAIAPQFTHRNGVAQPGAGTVVPRRGSRAHAARAGRPGPALEFRAEVFNLLNTVNLGAPPPSPAPPTSARSRRRSIRASVAAGHKVIF